MQFTEGLRVVRLESTVTDSEKNRTFDPTIIPKTNGLDPRFQSDQLARTTEPVPELCSLRTAWRRRPNARLHCSDIHSKTDWMEEEKENVLALSSTVE